MSLALERFELRAFGPFTGTVLELQGSPGSLHLIAGENEAGKSTAQRAIGDFLFGIPARSSDNQLHAHPDMRLAASLLDGDGGRHELVRRKGTRSTLLDAEGRPLDDGILERLLGGMNRETFSAMFSITHESLVVGGQALLAAGGEVGESLFSASLGASSLHRVRESLDADADELFRPRASSSLIMQARARLEAAEAALRETTLRGADFLAVEQALADALARRDALAGELQTARAEQNRRRRTRTLIPLVLERGRILSELAGLDRVPLLGSDAAERRGRAEERINRDRAVAEEAADRTARLDEQLAALGGGEALLEREAAISAVLGRVAGVSEGADELADQRARLQAAQVTAARVVRDIAGERTLEDPRALLLDTRRRQRIDAALEAHTALRTRLGQAEGTVAQAARRAEELRLQARRRVQPLETAALGRAVAGAVADGPLEAQLRDAERELAEAEDTLAVALAGLEPAVAASAIAEQTVPSVAAVQRFIAQERGLEDRRVTLAAQRERLEGQLRDLAEDRARLRLGTEVPSLEELSFARARRDRDWNRIRARLEGDGSVEISPENLERGISLADEIADTLRQHAGYAAQAAELDVRGARLEAEFNALGRHDEALAGDRERHDADWVAAWHGSGITPLTPQEMAQWLHDRATAIDRILLVTRCRRSVRALAGRVERHRVALTEALAWLGAADGVEMGLVGLTGLISLARETIDAAEGQRVAAHDLERELESVAANQARERAAVRGLERELRDWRTGWSELVADCGWPADVAAEDARQMLSALEELGIALREVDQCEVAVAALAEQAARFAADAGALVAELAPELTDRPAAEAIGELGRRLRDASERASRRRGLETERENAALARDRAEQSLAAARQTLAELLAAAGVEDVEALVAVEERAARRDALRRRLPEVEEQITQAGQAPLEEIVTRAAAVDVDVLDAESAAGDARVAELESLLRELDERRGGLESERAAMERSGGAAAAGQAVAERLAELRELVERYLRTFVAAWALREAIDQYRRDHKDPLLRRASELFPQLTRGSFAALEADFDEADEPVLIGVRANGERVRVAQMSTGTREQLYLALRLASLERHVELHGPMPVVLDDVVLHSDPGRKAAILTALGELSRRTQVICFSHDPGLVTLARETLDPALLTVHELGGHSIDGALRPAVGAGDVRPIRRPAAA